MSILVYALRGDARRKKLDALQDRIEALLAERAALDATPVTLDEVKQRVLTSIQSRAGNLRFVLRRALRTREARGLDLEPAEPLTLADLALLFGNEAITERLVEVVKPELDGLPEPVSEASYSARVAQISTELTELQLQEEREVLALFDAGVKAARRESADAALIFQVWSEADA